MNVTINHETALAYCLDQIEDEATRRHIEAARESDPAVQRIFDDVSSALFATIEGDVDEAEDVPELDPLEVAALDGFYDGFFRLHSTAPTSDVGPEVPPPAATLAKSDFPSPSQPTEWVLVLPKLRGAATSFTEVTCDDDSRPPTVGLPDGKSLGVVDGTLWLRLPFNSADFPYGSALVQYCDAAGGVVARHLMPVYRNEARQCFEGTLPIESLAANCDLGRLYVKPVTDDPSSREGLTVKDVQNAKRRPGISSTPGLRAALERLELLLAVSPPSLQKEDSDADA